MPEWLVGVWRAWHRLTLDRPWLSGGMGAPIPCRIPWQAVVSWCEFHNLPGDAVAFYDSCFAAMDAEFFAWHKGRA